MALPERATERKTHAGRRIRVVQILPCAMLDHGPTNVVLTLAESLPPAEFESEVWSLSPPPPGRSIAGRLQLAGVGVREFRMAHSILDARILPDLIRALRHFKPQVLIAHLIRPAIYARLASLRDAVPVVSVSHNVERYMLRQNLIHAGVCWVDRLLEPRNTMHVAVSHEIEATLIKRLRLPSSKVVTIHNGLALQGEPLAEPASSPIGAERCLRLLNVARLHPQKNQALLLEAIAIAKARDVRVQCCIAGEGPERDALQAAIGRLGLSAEVKLLGARTDVEQLLQQTDVFVLTSVYEGLPIALLEAMRAAICCVVTDVGGMPEAVQDKVNGRVFSSGDASGLAAILEELALDAGQRQRLGQSARLTFQQSFTAERMTLAYAKLIRQVTAGGVVGDVSA